MICCKLFSDYSFELCFPRPLRPSRFLVVAISVSSIRISWFMRFKWARVVGDESKVVNVRLIRLSSSSASWSIYASVKDSSYMTWSSLTDLKTFALLVVTALEGITSKFSSRSVSSRSIALLLNPVEFVFNISELNPNPSVKPATFSEVWSFWAMILFLAGETDVRWVMWPSLEFLSPNVSFLCFCRGRNRPTYPLGGILNRTIL